MTIHTLLLDTRTPVSSILICHYCFHNTHQMDALDRDDNVELLTITAKRGRQLREIALLEGVHEVDVDVTESKHQELVCLPPWVYVSAPALCAIGNLLWIPEVDVKVADVVMSTNRVVTRRCMSVVQPVEGLFVRVFDCYDGAFKVPSCVAVKGGTIILCYVSNGMGIRLICNDALCVTGNIGMCLELFCGQINDIQHNFPGGVAVSGDETIVCDAKNDRVLVFGKDDMLLRVWGDHGHALGQFDSPRGVAVNGNGDEVIVCDAGNHRMQVFGMDGKFVREWGAKGKEPGKFDTPVYVALMGEHVIVCDSCNHRMQVFRTDGTFVREWGTFADGPGQFKWPVGVAVKGKEIIVCDSNNNRIQVFGVDGAFVREWGTDVNGDGQFNWPHGVAVNGDEVIVCDSQICL